MGLLRGVHMHAHLQDGVGNVSSGEAEILEHVGQAPVRRRRSGPRLPQRASLECRQAWSRACSLTCQPVPGRRWRTGAGEGRDPRAIVRR
jgi:hypothetical protein